MNQLKDNASDMAADRFAIIQKLGLEYSAEFVPFSKSRNRHESRPSLNWRVTIKRGNQSLTTDYMQGCGHIEGFKQTIGRLSIDENEAIRHTCETRKLKRPGYLERGVQPEPRLEDVLYSLVLDTSVLDSPTYEDWAGEFGYDVDSRKGELTYRACLEIGLKLRVMLGNDNLEKLRDLYQDY